MWVAVLLLFCFAYTLVGVLGFAVFGCLWGFRLGLLVSVDFIVGY